jgi:hypothetical protein
VLGQLSVTLRNFVARFVRESDGSVAVTFSITLIPILIAVGAAVDYSRANNLKVALQTKLDSALLAGAKDGSSAWKQVASDAFGANSNTKFGSASTPTFTQNSAEVYSGSVSGSLPTTFLSILRIDSIKVAVSATAMAADSDDSCILTLDHGQPTSHVSLSLNGAPIVNLAGCSIRSNTALDCNGHDGNATKSIAAGTAADCSRPKSNAPVVPDFYASLAGNITTACGASRPGVTWQGGELPFGPGVITVDKGSYTEYHICGDLTLSGSGALTGNAPSSDSVIIVENGSLTVSNGSSISASRTAIVMTGDNNYPSSVNFPTGNGQSASLSLSAPTDSTDPWQGVALYQDPKLTNHVNDTWGPGATFNADGLVYLGNADVVTHGVTGSSNSKCSKFVMNSFTTDGNVNLNLDQSAGACSALGLKQWDGVIVHLTK